MQLTVHFHGLCLFTTKDPDHSSGFRVLLPESRTSKHNGRMKDGKKRPAHRAGLLVRDTNPKKLARIWQLNDTSIWFEPLGMQPAPVNERIPHTIPHVNEFAGPLILDPTITNPRRLIAQVELGSWGRITTSDEPAGAMRYWTFPSRLRPNDCRLDAVAEHVSWVAHFPDGVRVHARDRSGRRMSWTHQGVPSMELFIGNTDFYPQDIPSRVRTQTSIEKPVPDDDFKWYYELLEHPGYPAVTLRQHVASLNAELPVPVAVHDGSVVQHGGDPIFTADTPTCLCGFFCEHDPPHG